MAGYPRYRRNSRAILRVYNITMPERKGNFQVDNVTGDLIPSTPERHERDSLLKRRLIGAAIIIALVLLGLAFPVVI